MERLTTTTNVPPPAMTAEGCAAYVVMRILGRERNDRDFSSDAEFDFAQEVIAVAIAVAETEARRDEREQCAQIAEAMRPLGGRMWSDEQHACYAALTDCAANIRTRAIEKNDAKVLS